MSWFWPKHFFRAMFRSDLYEDRCEPNMFLDEAVDWLRWARDRAQGAKRMEIDRALLTVDHARRL